MPARGTILPEGFNYFPHVISTEEETALLAAIPSLGLAPVAMRGFVAKRLTAHFGVVYGYASWRVTPGPPIPAVLAPFRDRAAELAGIEPAAFSEALVSEYPAGAAIGWHRDAPAFGPTVVGFSLGGPARMRFRRPDAREPARVERAAIVLEPRSAYVMAGPSRAEWQHSIPAVEAPRYSITFRSVSAGKKAGGSAAAG